MVFQSIPTSSDVDINKQKTHRLTRFFFCSLVFCLFSENTGADLLLGEIQNQWILMWDISLETLTKMFLITIFWGFEGIRQCLNISTDPHCCSVGIVAYRISTFVLNAPFLTALKTSENRKVFWCFQGEEKGCIGNNRIKALQWNQNFVQTSLRGSAELNQIIWAEPNYMWCY